MAHDYYSYGSLKNGLCIDVRPRYRFEPGSKSGALVEDTPCSLDHHGLASQVTLARMLMIGDKRKIHQTYSKQESNGDETSSRKVQASSTKSNPGQLY